MTFSSKDRRFEFPAETTMVELEISNLLFEIIYNQEILHFNASKKEKLAEEEFWINSEIFEHKKRQSKWCLSYHSYGNIIKPNKGPMISLMLINKPCFFGATKSHREF